MILSCHIPCTVILHLCADSYHQVESSVALSVLRYILPSLFYGKLASAVVNTADLRQSG